MKTEISRDSHQPDKRYSGVYQQQGRMLTDADWNELVDILKNRLDDALKDVVGNGSPRWQNVVDNQVDPPKLLWGYVHVDGLQAALRPTQAAGSAKDFEYQHQLDFPSPPALPSQPSDSYVFYADVWERTVTQLLDERLRDKGLHGADTCTRQQVLAQVKWCPTGIDPETSAQNPSRGDAPATITLLKKSTQPDPCDPCEKQVNVESRIGNYLFRVEVHAVGGAADAPEALTLKWSAENGAIQANCSLKDDKGKDIDPPEHFTSGTWAYEFFDDTSERHLGVHHADGTGWEPLRGKLVKGSFSKPASAPNAYVRRWDGFCALIRSGGHWQVDDSYDRTSNTGYVSVLSGNLLQIKLDAQQIEIDLNASFVAGDYWLAEVREAGDTPGKELITKAPPHGIGHHYLTLGRVAGGKLQPNPEADRKYAFPSLTEMTRMSIAGGDGQEVVPGIPLKPLPQPLRVAVANGEWPVAGAKVRFHIETGGGSLSPASGLVQSGADGIAACNWTPDSSVNAHYCVKATLVDPADDSDATDLDQPPVYFYANLITADQVAYTNPGCGGPANPTVNSLLDGDAAVTWPDNDGDGAVTVKDVLDALLCKLAAKHLPYDPTVKGSRWDDVNEEAPDDPGLRPKTVQDALDNLVDNLQSEDIKYPLPDCNSQTFKSLILASIQNIAHENGKDYARLKDLWDALMCHLDAAKIPYDPSGKGGRWDDINAEEGSPRPATVQDALDDLVANLQSEDIRYPLPDCGGNSNTLKALIAADIQNIENVGGKDYARLKDVWDALLCHLDAGKVPYEPGCDYLQAEAADTVKKALDALCKRPSGGVDCNAFLKIFGRGVLCGLIPLIPIQVNAIDKTRVKVTVSVSPGTVIDGHGCVRDVLNMLQVTDDLIGFRAVRQLKPAKFLESAGIFRAKDFQLSNRKTVTADQVTILLSDRFLQTLVRDVGTTKMPSRGTAAALLGDRIVAGATVVANRLAISVDTLVTELNAKLADALWEATILTYEPIEKVYYLYLVSPVGDDPYLEIRGAAPGPVIAFPAASRAYFSMPGISTTIAAAPMAVDPFSIPLAGGTASGNACTDAQRSAWAGYEWYHCPSDNGDGAVCLATIRLLGGTVWIYPDAREQIVAPALINSLISAGRKQWAEDLNQACNPQ